MSGRGRPKRMTSSGKDGSSMAKRARKTTENEVEVVQLAGDSQPQSGITDSQASHKHPIIDFEQIIKDSALLPLPDTISTETEANVHDVISVPSQNLQFEEPTLRCGSDDMSVHVPLQICQKIWQNQYINIALLLKGNVELHELCTGGVVHISDKGLIETRPKITKEKVSDIEKWTDAFLIFSSIYLKQHPSKAQELLQYMSIIREAANRNVGLA